MPQFDLSTLPAQELRQLLHSARQRGQAAQSYEILQEMEARRVGGEPVASKRPSRRAARASRTIVLDLGDPLERPDPLEAAIPDAEPPLRLAEPDMGAPPPRPLPTARQRWGHWAALCFAMGLGGGVATGWWAANGGSWAQAAPDRAERPAPASATRRPLNVVVADAGVTAAPAAAPAALASAPPPVDEKPAPDPAPVKPASPEPVERATLATAAQPEAADPEAKLQTAAAPAAASAAPGCSAELTPADQTICGTSRLRRLQTELRQAYAEALQAHEDRSLLRQRQLAWRVGRNAITDPEQLARIYERRIAQLRAAAMDASRQRDASAHGSQHGQGAAAHGRGA